MKYAIILNEATREHFESLFDDMVFFSDDSNIYDIDYQDNDILFVDFDSITVEIDDLIKYLKELCKKVDIVALRMQPNVIEGAYVLKSGFKSYINSRTNNIIIQQVVQTIQNGNVWVYPELMSYIVTKIDTKPISSHNDKLELLTPKEVDVASLVAQGFTNKKIAHTLDIAEITVKKHLTSIFHKLDVKDRVSLVVYLK
jgi:DNA-binding NarL/FixJ family response regulator